MSEMPLRLLLILLLLTPTVTTFAAEAKVDGEIVAAELEAGHGDAANSGTPDPLATDPDLAIWTLIVFLVMLAILSQTAWKPIMEGLKAREDNITGAIAAAQRTHEEAKALLAEHQAKIAGAADQVREMLAEAHRDAETTIAKAKADAKAEFDEERQRATRDIEQARDAAVRALAERTAGLAIDLAGRVVKQEITPARQSEIVREALGRFTANGASAN
jgi:F-type H+-transporting ATPase subunit b